MRVVSICLLFALVWTLAAGDECHTPDLENVGSEPGLAADICAIGEALDSTPPDYATTEAIYEKGRNSKSPTLLSIATAEYDTAMWNQYAEFFGDSAWMDLLIMRALKGRKPFVTDTMRTQVIKKVLQGSVLVQQVMYHVDQSLAFAMRRKGADALTAWERAMAVYYGADVDCAVFGNGQSRGIEFGTLKEGMAETNYLVGEEFGEGAEVLKAKKPSIKKIKAAGSEIMRNIIIIYLQSTLKYASIIDAAIESGEDFEKAQAEGFGYMHAILPVVAEFDAGVAQRVFNVFNLRRTPSEEEAEAVAEDLGKVFSSLRIEASSVKSFDATRKDDFQPPEEFPCESVNPFAGDVKVGDTDADR